MTDDQLIYGLEQLSDTSHSPGQKCFVHVDETNGQMTRLFIFDIAEAALERIAELEKAAELAKQEKV